MLTIRFDAARPAPGRPACSMSGAASAATRSRRARRGASVVALDYADGEVEGGRATPSAAMAEAGEIADERLRRRASTATPPACRSPTTPSTASSRREVLEHIPDDVGAIAEMVRVLRPGGTIAVTVPAWLPEKINWMLTDEYHAPIVEGGHVRIYTATELAAKLRARRARRPARPPRPRAALAVLVAAVRGRPDERRPTGSRAPTASSSSGTSSKQPAVDPRRRAAS